MARDRLLHFVGGPADWILAGAAVEPGDGRDRSRDLRESIEWADGADVDEDDCGRFTEDFGADDGTACGTKVFDRADGGGFVAPLSKFKNGHFSRDNLQAEAVLERSRGDYPGAV